MAIQGTQVPMYTNTPFLYFSNFQFFYMKSKINQTEKKTNKNKAMHKTRCKCMRKEEEKRRSIHGDNTNI